MRPSMFVLLTFILSTGVLFLQTNCEQQPDIITTKINDYYGFKNKFGGFTCEASGTNLKFYWRHRDQLVDKDYPLKFPKLNSSTLQPNKDFLSDAYDGTYQCFASNSIGTVFGRKATVKFTIVGDFYDDASKKTIKEVVAGQPSWIHCPRHDTSYNVKYKWEYKQAFEHVTLPPSPRYFVSENGTLYFASIELKDVEYINGLSGIHCKQQANIEGEQLAKNSHQITLFLKATAVQKSKPVIKTVIGTQSVFFGEKLVVFKCGAIGNPIPDLKWYKLAGNGGERTEIKNGKGYKLERFNQFLSILDVTTNKAGDYLCVANNTEGKAEASGRIIVADRPQWTMGGSLSDVNPAIESEFVWECEALGGATYTWYKDGNQMSRRSSQQGKYVVKDVDAKSQLIFTKVTEDNNGMYQCTAGNEKDTIYSTGRLKVKIKKPEFLESMGPLTLIRTTKGVILCPVDAAPLPVIVWKKDSQRITYDKRIKLADNKRDLLVANVSDSDQGRYTCVAENDLGVADDSSYVTVGADITVLEAPVSNRNVTERFRFELDCKATGDPSYEVKYMWLLNGLPLQYNARIHWVKDKYKLLVLDALVSDTGTYTCIAFAETPLYIQKRMDVDIVVRAPANPPDIVFVSDDCYKKDAVLNWKVGALNNEEIYFFIIQWATAYDPGRWEDLPRINREDAKSAKLNFNLLPPYSQISFRVILANRIGHSLPSIPTEASECITPPSAPPFSPELIYGIAEGDNTLKLIWTPVHQMYWGSAGFNYTVQYRRKTKDGTESRWDLGKAVHVRIYDGNIDSIVIPNPGYYNEWEFRIRSNNHYGSSELWTKNTSFSGQNSPGKKPTGLEPDRISSRSVDISWQRVSAPLNGSIEGYRIEYWRSVIGVDVAYQTERIRKKRDDEEEEEELDMCFDPLNPCVHLAPEKESKLDDLQPYKLYHVRIAAFNSGGRGPLSNELTFETEEDTPGEPYAVDVYAYGQYAKLTWKEPVHKNGKILNYEVFGKGVVTTLLPWWMRRHIIYDLNFNDTYEAKLRARTSTGWGEPVFRWFRTTRKQKPAKPLLPEVVGYGADGVNVTFMEPKPILTNKFGGPIDEDPWETVPVDGFDMEHKGTGGYPEVFQVLYRKVGAEEFKKTEWKQMYSERDQTWIIIENLEKFALYEFTTVPKNKQGEGPRSDLAIALPGGIVPQVQKLHWYQRDWFIALSVIFAAASLLFLVIVGATYQLKDIYYEGAPKRRKDRERERIYEPEDVDGGFNEFTLKSARSSRSVVTSRSEAPPPYSITNGSASRHSGDFDDEDLDSDEDDEKNEVSTYYSDDKKVPLDDLEEDEEEDSRFATFV